MPQNMWSRRRAAVQAEADADERAQRAAVVAQEHAALEEKSDAEILTELELPDPDGMQAGDDFAAFMKTAVPERLRRRALRKLWLSDPVLANLDSLVDYGENFTDAATVIENMKTAYQVGRGMLKHVLEVEKAEAALDQDEEAGDLAEKEAQELTVTDVQDIPDDDENAEATQEQEQEQEQEAHQVNAEDEMPDFVVKRRMRFEFAS